MRAYSAREPAFPEPAGWFVSNKNNNASRRAAAGNAARRAFRVGDLLMRMTTGRRLAIGFGFVTVLMLSVAVLAIVRLDALNGQLDEAATREAPKLQVAHEILALANDNARLTFELFVSSEREAILRRIDSNRRQVTDKLAKLDALADTPRSHALLVEARERRDAFVASFGAVAVMLESGREAQALRAMTGETLGRIDHLNETLNKLVVQEAAQLQRMAEAAGRETARDKSLLIVFVLLSFSAATAFALWIIRTVVEPLGGEPEEAKRAALAIASGELDVDIRVREGDDRSLMAAMKVMQENMRLMVGRLREDADQLQALNARLDQRVQERTAQLEASNQELESMSFAVAHDLRQPLRAIEGFSTVLREDCEEHLDLECRDYAGRIAGGAHRMSEMIDALLGLTRLTRSECSRQPVDLSALARSVAGELFMLEPGRRAEILVDDGMQVEADAGLLRVVLQNLIANAWKFTRTREHALIEVGCYDEGGRRVHYVRDNGVGFSMEQAGRLFAPFQRFHAREKFEGHGIGLASVRRAVRRHGGHVWAESEPGKGSSFYFVLEGADDSRPCLDNGAKLRPRLNGA